MPTHVGVDWASGIWVTVKLSGGEEPKVRTFPSILNVWDEYSDVDAMLVDIPIGLPEEGKRRCDEEARSLLGQRGSTVFNVPCREAVESNVYKKAKAENESAGSGGLGSQSWWIIPQIREVDVFLRRFEEARGKIYESHPEVCFAAFNGKESLPKKDSKEGREERLKILNKEDPDTGEYISNLVENRSKDKAEWHHRIQSGRRDDIIDAAVLAVTAKRIGLSSREAMNEYPRLPQDASGSPKDDKGLPMEIVYPGT